MVMFLAVIMQWFLVCSLLIFKAFCSSILFSFLIFDNKAVIIMRNANSSQIVRGCSKTNKPSFFNSCHVGFDFKFRSVYMLRSRSRVFISSM